MSRAGVESFWDFSVRTYRTPGVPDACLSLQDEYDVDVNMLLYCCWVAARLGHFDGELFGAARYFSREWAENVVIPLRMTRTWMKHGGCTNESVPTDECMRLREEIKTVEFESEKLQQQVLESLVTVDENRGAAADGVLEDVVGNLMLFSDYVGFDLSEDVCRKYHVIVAAAFPDWDEGQIGCALGL